MSYQNIFYILIFLLIIYLIDKEIFSPRSLVVYLFFIILWNISHNHLKKKENFNNLIPIGTMKKYNPFQYYYDKTDKVFTSSNYYNKSNCTLENKPKNSCIIPPNTINQFTVPNLKEIANNTSQEYQPNTPIIKYSNCLNSNIKQQYQDKEFFSTVTPNIPDGTICQEDKKCYSPNIYPNGPGIYSKPPKGCCPQGYVYDNQKDKCKQFCRGCQTGTCNNGWCFSQSSCKNNN